MDPNDQNQSFIQKYKWWLIAGGGALVVLFLVLKGGIGSGSGASSTGSGSVLTTVPDTSTLSDLQNIESAQAQELGAVNGIASQFQNASNGIENLTLGGVPGAPNSGIWSQDVVAFPSLQAAQADTGGFLIPYGQYQSAGSIQQGSLGGIQPIQYEGGTSYVLGENIVANNPAPASSTGTTG